MTDYATRTEIFRAARELGFKSVAVDPVDLLKIRFNFKRHNTDALESFVSGISELCEGHGYLGDPYDPVDAKVSNNRKKPYVEFTLPDRDLIRRVLEIGEDLEDLNARPVTEKLRDALKDGIEFLRPHFTPVESFKQAARVPFLRHHNNAMERFDGFKDGNDAVKFQDTIFSSKVAVWAHLKLTLANYKNDRRVSQEAKAAYEKRQAEGEQRRDEVPQDVRNRAKKIYESLRKGQTLDASDEEFSKALRLDWKGAIKAEIREQRKKIQEQLDADKRAYKALPVQRKASRKTVLAAAKRRHDQLVKTLSEQRKHAAQLVHENFKALDRLRKSPMPLTEGEKRQLADNKQFLDLHDSIGERRMIRATKQQMKERIRAEDQNLIEARIPTGSPAQRLMTRLHLVFDEAMIHSVANVGANAAILVGDRAEATAQLVFDMTLDYTIGLIKATAKGAAAGLHGATVKPAKAVVRQTLNL